MAKLRFQKEYEEGLPPLIEEVEASIVRLGGRASQLFYIGSGLNFSASANLWLEVKYSFNGVPAFHTRTFLHHLSRPFSKVEGEKRLASFARGENDSLAFGDMMPESSIVFKRNKFTYDQLDGQKQTYISYELEIAADVGVVLGGSAPGERFIAIRLKDVSLEDGVQFFRDLYHELLLAYRGKHPDPAHSSTGSGDWHFARQFYQIAYDQISSRYQADYFSNPWVTRMFETWLDKLPTGGHILDAGCGHGDPVISRLLARGFQVTGTDISSAMLAQARQNFPGVSFRQRLISEIDECDEYDGACSLSSLLYLDPIDLYHSIYRLFQALKPGGLLFLFAYDIHPVWRGLPFSPQLDQWMWSWTYSKEEVVRALEEHGYFKVLKARRVTSHHERKEFVASWKKKREDAPPPPDYSELDLPFPLPPIPNPEASPKTIVYSYALIAQKRSINILSPEV